VEEWLRLLIGESHHSGGFVETLMSQPVVTFIPEMMMGEVKTELRKKRIHGAPVVNDHQVVGMISLRDFRKRKKKDLFHPVKAFMSEQVIAIDAWKTAAQAAQLMVKHDVGRLPVIEGGRLVGIISRSDVMNHLYGFCPVDRQLTKGCKDQIPMLQT
jgi:tRNA nucleotidyltransferase (CCA-adding enzyme)